MRLAFHYAIETASPEDNRWSRPAELAPGVANCLARPEGLKTFNRQAKALKEGHAIRLICLETLKAHRVKVYGNPVIVDP